jgi:predicted DNA-binding transcriptional regulator AlpA
MAQGHHELFLKMRQFRERWSCSHMFVEDQLHRDPSFPKPIYLGRDRAWRLSEIERWEDARPRTGKPKRRTA